MCSPVTPLAELRKRRALRHTSETAERYTKVAVAIQVLSGTETSSLNLSQGLGES
jgi:hypothetical protein